jgi:Flp pilus assembly protein protease CpaA
MIFFISAFALYISWRDFRDHLILNRDLLIFAPILFFDHHFASIVLITIAITLSPLFSLLTIGGGDIKLLSLLFASQGSIIFSRIYLAYLSVALALALLIFYISNGRKSGSIALAPPILCAFLAAYLSQ